MDQPKDGGPAFPCTDAKGFVSEGMSLRDYFAGQALAGLLAQYGYGALKQSLITDCYEYADAMLAEREKQEGR